MAEIAVTETTAQVSGITEQEFEALKSGTYPCKTEVKVPGDLGLYMYSWLYENDKPTNQIVDINKAWGVSFRWCLFGSLRKAICGYWCISVHFESIGPAPEFTLKVPHYKFDCYKACWRVDVPGGKIDPSMCTDPYTIVTTINAESLCRTPAGILGHCNLGLVQFYEGP